MSTYRGKVVPNMLNEQDGGDKKMKHKLKNILTRSNTKSSSKWFSGFNNKRTSLIIGIVVVIIGAVGAVWAGYALWYQNPYKVVTDAVNGSFTAQSLAAKGDMELTLGKTKYSVDFTFSRKGTVGSSASLQLDATEEEKKLYTLKNELRSKASGDLYTKIENLDDVYEYWTDINTNQLKEFGQSDESIQQTVQKFQTFYGPIVSKVEEGWIQFTVDDLEEFGEGDATEYKCTRNVIDGLNQDEQKLDELRSLYHEHSFIIVTQKQQSEGSLLGYDIRVDKNVAKSFVESFKKTRIQGELNSCTYGKENDIVAKIITSKYGLDVDNVAVELWADKWSHELKRLSMRSAWKNGDVKTTLRTSVDVEINKDVKIEFPKKSTTIRDLWPALINNPVTSG